MARLAYGEHQRRQGVLDLVSHAAGHLGQPAQPFGFERLAPTLGQPLGHVAEGDPQRGELRRPLRLSRRRIGQRLFPRQPSGPIDDLSDGPAETARQLLGRPGGDGRQRQPQHQGEPGQGRAQASGDEVPAATEAHRARQLGFVLSGPGLDQRVHLCRFDSVEQFAAGLAHALPGAAAAGQLHVVPQPPGREPQQRDRRDGR